MNKVNMLPTNGQIRIMDWEICTQWGQVSLYKLSTLLFSYCILGE